MNSNRVSCTDNKTSVYRFHDRNSRRLTAINSAELDSPLSHWTSYRAIWPALGLLKAVEPTTDLHKGGRVSADVIYTLLQQSDPLQGSDAAAAHMLRLSAMLLELPVSQFDTICRDFYSCHGCPLIRAIADHSVLANRGLLRLLQAKRTTGARPEDK